MYRFALVGCGNISGRHAENISRVGRLSAVCDIIPERAAALASKYQARAYASLGALLAGETDTEIIVICTPNGLHADLCIEALNAGKHVLCEKPMCLTTVDALRMVKAADRTGRKIFVVKQNRYNEPVQLVKQLLDDRVLSDIYSFQMNCFWNRPQAYYTDTWKGTKALDGGILFTQFSHFVDLLYWFLGDVDKVTGYKHNYAGRAHFEIEDTGVAALRMQSGAVGTLNYTINSFKRNLEGSFSIFGRNGSVKIGGQYLNTLEWFEVEGQEKPVLSMAQAANDYGFYQGSMSNHHRVYDDLILSLGGRGSLLEAKDALATIQIIEKIYAASTDV